MARAEDFGPGDKVFIDSFAGLVPAVVVAIPGGNDVRVKYTGTRGAYKRGETYDHPASTVAKREWVHKKGYHRVIREPFRPSGKWEVQELHTVFIPGRSPVAGSMTFSSEADARAHLGRARARGTRVQLVDPSGKLVDYPRASYERFSNPFAFDATVTTVELRGVIVEEED